MRVFRFALQNRKFLGGILRILQNHRPRLAKAGQFGTLSVR
jgi:hypothetical protein